MRSGARRPAFRHDLLVLALWACIPALVCGQSRVSDHSLLELRTSSAAIVEHEVPLTLALSRIGESLAQGYVVFGIEVHLEEGREPTVNLDVKPNTALGHALQDLFGQLPNYEFQVVGKHLINVHPVGAAHGELSMLNVRVSRFDVDGEPTAHILSYPYDFIPELRTRLADPRVRGGTYHRVLSSGPGISLHLRNVTVRQILNAVVDAQENLPAGWLPLGWVYSFGADPVLPVGGLHSWKPHWGAAPQATSKKPT
jgi:hypothetical protein